MTSNMKRRK